MRKLLIIALLLVGYSCFTIEHETEAEYQKRLTEEDSQRRMDREKNRENREKARDKVREDMLRNTPSVAFIIEFPNLSIEEITNKSYLWLKTKFPNYDKILEKKVRGIIRIEGNNLLLASPEKMGYWAIIIIDTENKSVKFWIGKEPEIRYSQYSMTSSKDMKWKKRKRKSINVTEHDIKEEQAMDMVQSYKDFLLSR